MARSLEILLLTPRFPYPPHRGDKLKIYNIVKRLSSRHAVHLLAFISSRKELDHTEALRPYCESIETVHLPTWHSHLSCALRAMYSAPLQVSYYASSKMHAALSRALARQRFDVIHTHLIRLAQYTWSLDGIPRVLDLTDAMSLYLSRFIASDAASFKRPFLAWEWRRMCRYERILEAFDCCLVCSEIDRQALLANAPGTRVEITPNGVDLDYFSVDHTERNSHVVAYIGNMAFAPNADGILYFARSIWPRILRDVPDAQLWIVGQDPPRRVRRLGEQAGVRVTGTVPDIRDYYLRSAVIVCPTRFGAGTLNKVLEPLALGLPVVASSVAAEGLDVRRDDALLVADDPEDFARRVVDVLRDPAMGHRLGACGQAAVRAKYGWDRSVAKLESVYYELVDRDTGVERDDATH